LSKPPSLMATQHPDTSKKYFLEVDKEIDEAIKDLMPVEKGGYGCDEKMIDYEGKLTPFLQPRWILERLHSLEKGLTPGKDFLLTVRIPLEEYESVERHVLTLVSVMMANMLSEKLYGEHAIKYLVHPLTRGVRGLERAQRRALKLIKFMGEEFGLRDEDIFIVPLIEDVSTMLRIRELILTYNVVLIKMGVYAEYLRVFLGKSDSSLAYGHLTSVYAIKIALRELSELTRSGEIEIYPIVGSGLVPFRGHLAPWNVNNFTQDYSGYWTVTVQSALRFDIAYNDYLKTRATLLEAKGREPILGHYDLAELRRALELLTLEYLKVLTQAYDRLTPLFESMPKTRARMERARYGRRLHEAVSFISRYLNELGLRSVENIVLPRAIIYTASWYTIGFPPSLIGLGRGLERVRKELSEDLFDFLIRGYKGLCEDLKYEEKFTVLDATQKFLNEKTFSLLLEDLDILKEYLDFIPNPSEHYYNLCLEAVKSLGNKPKLQDIVLRMALHRKSLG